MDYKIINKVLSEINIDYVIYGNFNFIDGENEDIDLLIKNKDFSNLIDYLKLNNIKYHSRNYYPGQLFITGTEIKLHITNDLFIGGRNVAYLIKLKLINNVFKNKVKWNGHFVINSENYLKYRVLKKMINPFKSLKIEEYPFHIEDWKKSKRLKYFLILILSFFRSFIFIPFRFFKKRIWARL